MSTLYLVSSPIGNLGDFSPRAEETLRSVQRVLAEDTRRTRVLTERAGATAPLVSVHAHNERERTASILGWLEAGEELALVSDAGTPLVSDPGARVVQAVVAAGHRVVPIPGPSAVLSALIVSGLPSDRFCFLGFLERKGEARRRALERIAESEETVILFESPRRLAGLFADLRVACGAERRVAVARELTKIHEEVIRGTLEEASGYYEDGPPKGEVTVVVGPAEVSSDKEADVLVARQMAAELLAAGQRPSSVARELSDRLDLARNEAYRIVHDLDASVDPE